MGLLIFLGVIILSSSIWAAYDSAANEISIDSKDYDMNNGCAAWFFSCLILWPASFPYYLVKRSQHFNKTKQ